MTPEELQQLKEASKAMTAEGMAAASKLNAYEASQNQVSVEQEAINAATEEGLADQKPAWAGDTENPLGNIAIDTTKILANAGVGLVTDVLDLAAGIGDTVVQTGNLLQGKDWDWDAWMNDSDNGWTRWRRETFKTSTQAAQTASNFLRLGTLMATLPKAGASLAARGAKAAAGVSKASRAGGVASAIEGGLTANRNAKLAGRIQALAKGKPAGDAKKALDIAGNTPEISGALRGAVQNSMIQGPGVASYSQKVGQRLKNVGISIAERYRPRNLAQTLGYDALATFMVSGEGVLDFDETVSDLAKENGIFYVPALTTSAEDSAFAIKMKQTVEGLPIGAALQPLIDMWTIGRFAKRIKNADPKLKEELLELFAADVNDLGRSVAKVYTGQYGPQQYLKPIGPSQFNQLGGTGYNMGRAGAQAVADGANAAAPGITPRQPLNNDIGDPFDNSALARLEDVSPRSPYPANQPAGALARLVGQTEAAKNLQKTELTAAAQAADERFLRKQDPFIDDELATTPGSEYTGGPQTELGIQEVEVEVDPGAGALPGRPAAPALNEAVDEVPIRVMEPDPFDLPDGPVTSVEWKSPKEIADAFAADASEAFKKSIEFQDPQLAGDNFLDAAASVKRLMPDTRISALDYLKKNNPTLNGSGVLSASDSVWTNFIVNRGLKEGWIQVDGDFNFVVNRETARTLDTGASAGKALQKLDEVNQLEELEAATGMNTKLEQAKGMDEAEAEVVDLFMKKRGRKTQVVRKDGTVVGEFTRRSQAEKFIRQQTQAIRDDLANRPDPRQVAPTPTPVEGDTENFNYEIIQAVLGIDRATVDDMTGAIIDTPPGTKRLRVTDYEGEELGVFRRESEAVKFLEKREAQIKEDLMERVRQAQADATPERLDIADAVGPIGTDEPLMGKLTFSKRQKEMLSQYSDELAELLNADPRKKTYDFDYYAMNDFKAGMQKMIQDGTVKGNEARVLRNLIDKITLQTDQLDPIARARAKTDEISRLASREMDHNDYCF